MDFTEYDETLFAAIFSGKRLLRQEIPLSEPLFQQALNLKHFTSHPAITKVKSSYQCQRCGTKQQDMLPLYPCQTCNNTHPYCRNCIMMGKMQSCASVYSWTGPEPGWPTHEDPCNWDGELTEHQLRAAKNIVNTISNRGKLLVHAVCGAGKTEMLFLGLTEAFRRGLRVCLASPRADVIRELKPRFETAFPEVDVQTLYGGSKEKHKPGQFVLTTTHQLLRFHHAFDVLIIDEIDAFPYHTDKTLHFAASRAQKLNAALIYLTATPRTVQQRQIRRRKLPVVFVPLRFHGHPLPVPKPVICYSLKKRLQQQTLPKKVFRWLDNRENQARQLLFFIPAVPQADTLCEQMQSKLLPYAKKISSADSKWLINSVHAADKEREEKVQAFRNKETAILFTTTILERGVTFPSVDVAILDAGHQVFDEAAIVQIAGRAGRSPDDPYGEVMLFHDGRTDAMFRAIHAISKMNRRGEQL